MDLVDVRYFEIEEGERGEHFKGFQKRIREIRDILDQPFLVNVTKMNSEDMKHFEMHEEGRHMREMKGGGAAPWATELPLPKGVHVKPVSGFLLP